MSRGAHATAAPTGSMHVGTCSRWRHEHMGPAGPRQHLPPLPLPPGFAFASCSTVPAVAVTEDPLVVSLLDGQVVALSPVTGRVLWGFDTGGPLVSSKQPQQGDASLHVFPGAAPDDGGLYAYYGSRPSDVASLQVPPGNSGLC